MPLVHSLLTVEKYLISSVYIPENRGYLVHPVGQNNENQRSEGYFLPFLVA